CVDRSARLVQALQGRSSSLRCTGAFDRFDLLTEISKLQTQVEPPVTRIVPELRPKCAETRGPRVKQMKFGQCLRWSGQYDPEAAVAFDRDECPVRVQVGPGAAHRAFLITGEGVATIDEPRLDVSEFPPLWPPDVGQRSLQL